LDWIYADRRACNVFCRIGNLAGHRDCAVEISKTDDLGRRLPTDDEQTHARNFRAYARPAVFGEPGDCMNIGISPHHAGEDQRRWIGGNVRAGPESARIYTVRRKNVIVDLWHRSFATGQANFLDISLADEDGPEEVAPYVGLVSTYQALLQGIYDLVS